MVGRDQVRFSQSRAVLFHRAGERRAGRVYEIAFTFEPGYPAVNGMEVDKIYFRLPFKGRGIGKQLMAVALQEAKGMPKEIVWLAVIDTNRNAIEFYKKIGFEIHSRTI